MFLFKIQLIICKQLIILGGNIKVFGVGNGKLLNPITKMENGQFLPEAPKDNREIEVVYVGAFGAIALTYGSLMVNIVLFQFILFSDLTL